ncbi:MAG: glycosyltransferase [Gemmatimonadota bacterium]|nr:glycosyltransferase [Gemmatimonadota bacterium]
MEGALGESKSNAMRDVLLIGPYPPPYGGPGVHMMHLRRALEAEGARCVVLSIWASGGADLPDVLRARSGAEYCMTVLKYFRKGFHVHHLFNVESWKAIALAALAAILARMTNGSYSIGFIGGPAQRYLDRSSILWGQPLRMTLKSAEFIICNNELVLSALTRRGAPVSRVHPIPAFHAEQVAEIGVLEPECEEFVTVHDPVLCAIVHPRFETGLPHHEMNLLIQALNILSSGFSRVGCVVMGGAGSVSEYAQAVETAGLADHFHFTGELSHRDCLAVMRASSVFVRAYLRDGTSSSVREALALGTPAVASRNPQHPPSAEQFEPNDASSLAATVKEVVNRSPGLRRELRDSGEVLQTGLGGELALFRRSPAPRS